MKHILTFVAFVALAVGLSAAESPYYAKTAQVAKVVSHEAGYQVTYLTNKFEARTIYIPMEWFYASQDYRNDDGVMKAEVIRGRGEVYPYIQFFWKDGKFHHLRLYVVNDYNDKSWGQVIDPKALAAQFDPKKALDPKF